MGDLTRLIDTANAPIFGIDKDFRINEWNQMAAKITGYPTHTNASTHARMYARMHVRTHARTQLCAQLCAHGHTYAPRAGICTRACNSARTHASMHTRMDTCTHAYTYA